MWFLSPLGGVRDREINIVIANIKWYLEEKDDVNEKKKNLVKIESKKQTL